MFKGEPECKHRYLGLFRGFSAGALGFSVGLTFSEEAKENFGFRVKLGLLCKRLKDEGHGVLNLIDEVQSISEELRLFAKTYQNLIGDGRNIAVGMAEDEGPSRIADIKARLSATDNQVQPYRARLIDAQVIASPRRGELEFAVPYLGEHLRNAK